VTEFNMWVKQGHPYVGDVPIAGVAARPTIAG
jgi:hypothetical protein